MPHHNISWRQRLWRLGWIGVLTGAALAFLVLPLLLTSENVLRTRWGADSKWDSHGWPWVMVRLLNGGLFDDANLPVITLLVALGMGLILVALRRKRDHLQIWSLACFALWVVLFFGRESLGSLIDLLPMSSGIHMSRFISGVQIFGLILAGLGLSTLIRWISRLRWVWALAAGALLVGVMAIPVSKRITFICQSDFWAISAKQGYDAALGFRDVVRLLEASPEARIHAGFSKTWGDELKIGGVPVYSLLQGAGFDMVGYLFLAQMHPEEWQFYLDPGRQEHYDLYNIRYLLMPASRTPPAFAQERTRWGNLVLYEVPTSGYFGLGSVADPSESELLADSFQALDWDEIYRVGDTWLHGPGPGERSYLAYGNRARTESFGGRQGVIINHWGIHLTGPVQARSSRGALRRRALQARWVPAPLRRRGRHCPGPLGGDEILVAHRVVGDGKFEHPIEHHPPAARAAAVEAEHELIQVAGQVRLVHRALVGAQQPPLGQRDNLVHGGQQLSGILPAGPGRPLAVPVVDVAELLQPATPQLTVSPVKWIPQINQMNAPGRYWAEVKAESEVGLILKVTYHPYWRATVDGVPASVTRVFPGFMAIQLDPGMHQVIFEYRAPTWNKVLAMLPPLLWFATLGSFGLQRWGRRSSSAEGKER